MIHDPPIFLVGIPRSGTTILAAMLSRHTRLHCGPETFFFCRWANADREGILVDKHWPEKAVQFAMSLELGGNKLHEVLHIDTTEIESRLQKREPSQNAILEALVVPPATHAGKVRWIEKTPSHLRHVRAVRQSYPNAQIIRIVRDPRAVALSLQKVPWASKSIVANLYNWQERDDDSYEFFECDANTITVRYEHLVADPVCELERICSCLGEVYEPAMLQPTIADKDLSVSQEWWKASAQQPLDRSRLEARERDFPARLSRIAEFVCGEGMDRYGYATRYSWHNTVLLYPTMTRSFIENHEDALVEAAEHGTRVIRASRTDVFSNRGQRHQDGDLVICGIPNLGKARFRRMLTLSRYAWLLFKRRFIGAPVGYFFCDTLKLREGSKARSIFVRLVTLLGRKQNF